MIAAVRERTQRPFNVNLFCHRPAVADPAREAAWISRLRPAFTGVGGEPPDALAEIYTSFVADPAMLTMLRETLPEVVSFHFGLPTAETIEALREVGCVLLACATNLAEAHAAADAGIDAIVAQGWEAGGHRGVFDPDATDERLDTLALVRRLAAALPVPVIAAGGLMMRPTSPRRGRPVRSPHSSARPSSPATNRWRTPAIARRWRARRPATRS